MRESDAFSGNLWGNKNSQPGDSPNLLPLTFSFFFFLNHYSRTAKTEQN